MVAGVTALTNTRINGTLEAAQLADTRSYPEFKVTNIIEMKAFIGILYYRGLYGLSKYRVNILFSHRHGP